MLRFRSATSADVPAIVALVESAYRGEASRAGWTTEADLLDGQRTDAREVTAYLETPGARFVLAERDGDLVGSVVVVRAEDRPGVARIGMLAVRPTAQAGGVGRALLGEAERVAAAELGCTVGEMTVIRQRATLIAWYGRRGWQLTGETEPFPYGDERFGVPRRPDLAFVVMRKSLAPSAPAGGTEGRPGPG